MDRQKKAYLYAILTVLLWSTVASTFKITLLHLNVIQILFYASFVSMAALFLILLCRGKLRELTNFWKQEYLYSASGSHSFCGSRHCSSRKRRPR
jgi:drug/metabolite transporter (DMT)-like permease